MTLDVVQLGLHVQVGNDVSAVKQDIGAFKDGFHLYQVNRYSSVLSLVCRLTNATIFKQSSVDTVKCKAA